MVMHGATAVVLDGPIAGKKALLVFNQSGSIYMQVDLPDIEGNCRVISSLDLREYFEGPAKAIDPTLSALILSELDKVERQ